MARPRGIPPELLPLEESGQAEAPGASGGGGVDPLAGYRYRPGRRGPRTTLRPEMIRTIAEGLARTGMQRIAAAQAGTTADCLRAWLSRGLEASKRRKKSIYTELLMACEEAWAHRYAHLIQLGELTVTDRHMNPRFITWLMAVTSPKDFTVPKEKAQVAGNRLGPAFEMVTPEAAAASLEEKLAHFLDTEEKVSAILAESAAAPEPSAPAAEAE